MHECSCSFPGEISSEVFPHGMRVNLLDETSAITRLANRYIGETIYFVFDNILNYLITKFFN